jgi:hypothetical protein
MARGSLQILGLTSVLLVAACDHIPYYNESLDWFSWSRYDTEVNEIVDEIPPPGELEAAPMAGPSAAADPPPRAAADLVLADPGVDMAAQGTASTVVVKTTAPSNQSTGAATPLVGIRNSVEPSVTWRSARGTP